MPEDSSQPKGPPALARQLGLPMAVAVVVGNVIGSGIFVKPGLIAGAGGQFGLIIGVWMLGGVLCILGALCFAELAAMLPRAGGLYVYLREAYGRPVAFLFGWADFLIRVPGSIAALSVVFVSQLTIALGWPAPDWAQIMMIAVVILGMAAINIAGVVWGGRVQMVTTLIKAGVLAAIALAPLVLMPFVSASIEWANYQTTTTPDDPHWATRISTVLLAVMWAYNGWHGITPLGEEVREPQKNIPWSLFIGVGVLIVLYIAANLAYHGVLSMDEVAEIGRRKLSPGDNARPTAAGEMLQRLIGPGGLTVIAAVVMCSTFGAINTNLLQAPRITYAMARDRVFFPGLDYVHATFRTPVAAISLTALMAFGLVCVVAVGKSFAAEVDGSQWQSHLARRFLQSLQDNSVFDLLTDMVIFAASCFYVLAVAAVIVLRIRRPELARPYRTWGYPIVPLLFIGVYVWFLWQVYHSKPLEAHTGLAFIAAGLPVYFFCRWWLKPKAE